MKLRRLTALLLAFAMMAAILAPAKKTEAAFNSSANYYAAEMYYKIIENMEGRLGRIDWTKGTPMTDLNLLKEFVHSATFFDYRWAKYRTSRFATNDRYRWYNVPYSKYEEIVKSYFTKLPSNLSTLKSGAGTVEFFANYNLDSAKKYTKYMTEVFKLKDGGYGARYTCWLDSDYMPPIRINCDFGLKFDTSDGKSARISAILDHDTGNYGFSGGLPMLNEMSAFVDVKPEMWYYDAAAFAFNEKIITGMDSSHFAPTKVLNRGQFVTMLYRMEGEPAVQYSHKFSDVANGLFYSKPVIWAAQNGIVNGYDDGTFGPAKSLTREQLATMLFRFAGNYKKADVELYSTSPMIHVTPESLFAGFKDGNKVSAFAKAGMAWAVNQGIITGKGANQDTLDPQGQASRAECATMLQRYAMRYGLK